MWRSDDQMFDDEVVPDGTQSRDRLSFPCLDSSKPFSSGGTSSQHLLSKSQFISKNTDSGFLSGASISESVSDIDCNPEQNSLTTQQQPSEMKIESASRYSDSGLSLDFSHSDLQSNNLSSPTKIQNDHHARRITLHDLLRQDEDGDTPLHLAVLQGFIEVVFSLVRILPDPRLLEIPNKMLQTPLHLAVLTNQAPLVRRLVVAGASVLHRDRFGNTPLHLACRDGAFECAKALLFPISQEERRAALLPLNGIPQPLPQDLEQRNYDGQLPLHLAAMNGHVQIVRLLCCFGTNINATEAKYGRTALHYAVERRQPTVLHYLVKECGAMTEMETYSGYTAYQLATAAAPMLAVLLVDLGAQVRPLPLDKMSSSDGEDDLSDGSDQYMMPSWCTANDQQKNLALMSEVLHLVA